jgi:KaiC/GvpD/RAD55 family RecA-like ATPase/5S rRNA maturation endonuclease (ribonuclease M5)
MKKMWKQEANSEKVLFNHDAVFKYDELILTEGELKTAALWQMGFQNTVSLTGGIDTFHPEWVDLLDRAKKIYLVMDSDSAGQRGAEKIAMRLGPERCFNICLKEAKDPDEYFFTHNHTADDFRLLMKKARKIDVRNIVSASMALSMLREEVEIQDVDAFEGLQTPWEPVNKLLKGMRAGDLIVLSAAPKMGKTTLALNIADYQAKDLNNPVLLFCLEMSSKRIARKLVQLSMNVEDDEINCDPSLITFAQDKYRSKPLYLVDLVKRDLEIKDIFEDLKACYRRYGLKLIIFDNLHFLVRTSFHLREAVGEVSQGFKLLAEELQIPIILIVHPRKLKNNKQMTSDDFKESGAIHADADQIIILHRKRLDNLDSDGDSDLEDLSDQQAEAILSPEVQVIIDASRFTQGGKTALYFEGGKSKFHLLSDRGDK